ncbi:MAG: sorbosone dehydrogenase family protein [Gammaproteobacteria bacterium]|nr:sorbosone dehydrogenase family protein [Gammaproteobacteria bacterium]
MHRSRSTILATLTLCLALAGCIGGEAQLQVEQGMGPNPLLPPPSSSPIPVVNVATAIGWPSGGKPQAAEGLQVVAFATGLDHPRWLHVLPNGDVLVAETAAPVRPEEGKGLKGLLMMRAQKRAGAAVPSANRITLLRDTDGDGVADLKSVFISGLNSPFGMALAGSHLYVANTDALLRFVYNRGATAITQPGSKVTDLPAGPRNHHWTKNVLANEEGTKLYVTVGSNSNVAEHGMQEEHERAAILEVDAATGQRRVFASGLRNPNGMVWEPQSRQLWTVVNERDELGSDLVPDYLTSVREGGFYGWPYSYFGDHVDHRPQPPRPDLVARAIKPDYALGPHTASLGLALSHGNTLPARYAHGMFVGQHGSWNRRPFSGYKVIFVPFTGGKPAGLPLDVLTGFVDDEGNARGRPVGVEVDRKGGLLVADDVGNVIWRVSARTESPSTR